MPYLAPYFSSMRDNGISELMYGNINLPAVLNEVSTHYVDYRKAVFSGYGPWMATVKALNLSTSNQCGIFTPVKNYASKSIEEVRNMARKLGLTAQDILAKVSTPTLMNVKTLLRGLVQELESPVITKVKPAKPIINVKPKAQRTDWKGRAIKAESELKEAKSLSNRLQAEITTLNKENEVLKTVAKQSILNNISLMNSIGIEVTQADLEL